VRPARDASGDQRTLLVPHAPPSRSSPIGDGSCPTVAGLLGVDAGDRNAPRDTGGRRTDRHCPWCRTLSSSAARPAVFGFPGDGDEDVYYESPRTART